MSDHDGNRTITGPEVIEGERPLAQDFYYDSMNGVWVYKWADSRLVLTTESVLEYQEDRRG